MAVPGTARAQARRCKQGAYSGVLTPELMQRKVSWLGQDRQAGRDELCRWPLPINR